MHKKQPEYRGIKIRSSAFYNRTHMQYKDILKMLIKWKKSNKMAYENKVNFKNLNEQFITD